MFVEYVYVVYIIVNSKFKVQRLSGTGERKACKNKRGFKCEREACKNKIGFTKQIAQ